MGQGRAQASHDLIAAVADVVVPRRGGVTDAELRSSQRAAWRARA
jgi:hypothetical protein